VLHNLVVHTRSHLPANGLPGEFTRAKVAWLLAVSAQYKKALMH
jgi:hypothetical protein